MYVHKYQPGKIERDRRSWC